jgi:hypothetical protein
VQVSSDGGSSWTDLERATDSDNSWQERSFLLTDYITPSEMVLFRFVASDEGTGSPGQDTVGCLIEAAVDDFSITGEPGVVAAIDFPGRLTLRLDPARPNPTASGAALSFTILSDGPVGLSLHSVDGRLVRTLVDSRLQRGVHRIEWDGCGRGGAAAPPGIYFAKLSAGGEERTRRIVLVR